MTCSKLLVFATAAVLALPLTLNAATIHATDVTVFQGANVAAERASGSSALGAPDERFLSLGLGGAAVFSFGQMFTGPASVLEVTWGKRAGYLETARVFVGNVFAAGTPVFNASDFTEIGAVTNADPLTSFAIEGTWRYLAFLDTSPQVRGRDGYDIDSVSVSTVPPSVEIPAIPLPASGLLLLGGLIGFARLRRKPAA